MKRSHALRIFTLTSILIFSCGFAVAQPKDPSNLPGDVEVASLVFFLEAETLAHDVYSEFYNSWEELVFAVIAASEATHADKIWEKIVKYELEELAATTPPALTDLHDEVMQAENFMEALRAAGLIEEVMIQAFEDIHPEISTQCLQVLYDHLYQGSRNHLRTFVRQYELLGEVYEVQVIDPDLFEAIISSPTERGAYSSGPSRRRSGPWFRWNSTTDPTGEPWARFWHGPYYQDGAPDNEPNGPGGCDLCPGGNLQRGGNSDANGNNGGTNSGGNGGDNGGGNTGGGHRGGN